MTACTCDYDSHPTVYRKSEHTARKDHKCRECGSTIAPGQRYEYVFAIWDGDAAHVRTCCRCLALRDFVVAHIPCSCWAHGNLLEDMAAEVEHYWTEAPGLLMGYLRRRAAVYRGKGLRRKAGAWIKTPNVRGDAPAPLAHREPEAAPGGSR